MCLKFSISKETLISFRYFKVGTTPYIVYIDTLIGMNSKTLYNSLPGNNATCEHNSSNLKQNRKDDDQMPYLTMLETCLSNTQNTNDKAFKYMWRPKTRIRMCCSLTQFKKK
jgi:hypothetical protein